jgi:uncharacterized protein YktA (UPF0223 family)
MEQNINYPIDPSWSVDEIEKVAALFNLVADAYEVGIDPEHFKKAYRDFKEVVPTKAQEKQLGREFYQQSGYQLYDVVKATRTSNQKRLKLKQE